MPDVSAKWNMDEPDTNPLGYTILGRREIMPHVLNTLRSLLIIKNTCTATPAGQHLCGNSVTHGEPDYNAFIRILTITFQLQVDLRQM